MSHSEVFLFRKAILNSIALRWSRSQLDFSVVHGLEKYPALLGRDIDVCVRKEDRSSAMRHIVSELKCNNWEPVVYRCPWAEWIVGYKQAPDGIIGVEIDLLSQMQWGWAILSRDVPSSYARQNMVPFRLDRWAGFVKRVLIQLLTGNINRFQQQAKHAEELVIYEDEMAVVSARLKKLFGDKEAAGLIAAIDRKDLQWINVHLMALRCVLLSRALLRPVELVQALFAWVRNEWVESIMPYPITPIVLLTGNKELIDYAAQTLSKRFEERFVFTSVKIQEGAKGHSIRFLWKRRVRSSRLGLTLVLYDVALPTQASLFRLISPVNLVLNVKSTDPDSILGYERQIIQCFAKMNASKDQF